MVRAYRLHILSFSMLLPLAVACGTGDDDSGDDVVAHDAGFPDSGVRDAGEVASCPPLGMELDEGIAPERRGDSAFAWDTECNRVFMFHGDRAEPIMCGPAASSFMTDAWTFDPARNKWAEIEVESAERPIQRARAVGAWDSDRNLFLLFGGRYRSGTAGAYTFMNDLWAYNPARKTWVVLSEQGAAGAPMGRMNTTMDYDPVNKRLVIWGGGQLLDFNAPSCRDPNICECFTVDDEAWEFSMETLEWRQLTSTGQKPLPRLFHNGALDPVRQRYYVFGGGGIHSFCDANEIYGDMWYLDLETRTWTLAASPGPDTPSPRIKGELKYDGAHDQMVLFAGHDNGALGNDNDVWTFDLETLEWTERIRGDTYNAPPIDFCDFPADFANVDPDSPERRESHVFVIGDGKTYMYGGRTDCGLANDTWVLDLSTYTWEQLSQSFTGMTCYRSGRTDCDQPGARKCG